MHSQPWAEDHIPAHVFFIGGSHPVIVHSTKLSFPRVLAGLVLAGTVACTTPPPVWTQEVKFDSIQAGSFATLSEQLSEPGGYFDTDNLISNESSYLHVLGKLRELGVQGGAYIGVGPGQNFSYIARIRPDIVFIVDIRRDNLLQHLLYKALFAISARRIDYVGALVGRDVTTAPLEVADWSVEDIVTFVDRAPQPPGFAQRLIDSVRSVVVEFGVPLSSEDLTTIERFHRSFIGPGLNLRFNSFGRAPQPYYPTLRDLFLERDLSGDFGNYLAREDDFGFVKELQRRNLVIPVVGDLGGSHALRAIGSWLDEKGVRVSAFYTSNVEFYLWGDGSFPRFADNISALPLAETSVFIRSYFGRRFRPHPRAVAGYVSTQLTQSMGDFVTEWRDERYRTYFDVVWMR